MLELFASLTIATVGSLILACGCVGLGTGDTDRLVKILVVSGFFLVVTAVVCSRYL
jgi:hypothetical protein